MQCAAEDKTPDWHKRRLESLRLTSPAPIDFLKSTVTSSAESRRFVQQMGERKDGQQLIDKIIRRIFK